MCDSPTIHLNHFYIVSDPATYGDILQCPFMRRQFAASELRTTKREDMSYSGLYFYGVNTYFEFFDSSNNLGQFPGDGIALGVDASGKLQALQERLGVQFAFDETLITREYNGTQIPWFHSTSLKEPASTTALRIWLMEYHPSFLQAWNPQPGNPKLGVRRGQILQRYISIPKDIPARPIFKDIAALTIAVQEPARKTLARLAAALGFRELTTGNVTELIHADIKLRIIHPEGEREGIREFTMHLNAAPQEQSEFRFGKKSILKFHNNKLATWSF